MGMDVVGNDATSERGEYFRNNVWWWRPLAEFCIANYADEVGFDGEGWHYNSGYGLNAGQAAHLARLIRADLADGSVAEYERRYNLERAELPRETCDLCNASGIRTDSVGRSHGMPDKKLSDETAILTGRTHGWCNACDGVGTRENWALSYPFTVENVREWCDFLEDCGGFAIW